MSENRLQRRLESAAGRGIGAGLPVNQKVSFGYSDEEARKAAEKARMLLSPDEDFLEESGLEEDEPPRVEKKKEEPEIPPPDKDGPSDDELAATAKILEIVRESKISPDDPLRDPRLRLEIEKSLEPIDLDQLLFHRQAEQEVTLLGGKMRILFRSLKATHYDVIDQWIYETHEGKPPIRKLKARSVAACAMMILHLNGTHFSEHVRDGVDHWKWDKKTPIDRKVFDHLDNCYFWLADMFPGISELIILNATWFEQRILRVLANSSYLAQNIKKS